MKSYKQFISEAVNISGDFNGNLYINSQQDSPQKVEETYTADILWKGSLYRLEFVSEGLPSSQDLSEELQDEYPGAIVQYIYPVKNNQSSVRNSKRYHPAKLDWI